MKKILLILVVLVYMYFELCNGINCFAEFDPFPQNRGTIYDYGDDIPDVCFFGEDAKWDGYEITSDDWFKFTDFLKAMFIAEGGEELGYDEFNGWPIIPEMNQVANDTPNKVKMIDILKIILIRDYT